MFVYMSACVITGGRLLSRALCGTAPHANAAWLLISYASIVFINTALGAASMLWPRYVALAAAAFLVFASLIYVRDRGKRKETPVTVNNEHERNTIYFQAIIFAPYYFVALVIFVWGVVAPPPPWDAFVYHLPFPATWLQNGAISTITVPFGDQAGTYFPANTELYFAWLMMPFRSEFLTSMAQFPFYLALGYLVYQICREVGVSRNAATAAALITLLLPGPMHQAVAAEVDVIFAALFLFSIYFLLVYAREPDGIVAGLAGLSLGLMAGTKYIGLTFAVIPTAAALWLMLRRGLAKHLILFILFAIFGGGFWYMRNWLLTGNPVFPLSISFNGIEIFRGGYPRESMMYSVFHAKSNSDWFHAVRSVPGAILGIFLAAGVVAGIYVSISKPWKRRAARAIITLLPVLLFLLCIFVIPYNKEARFTYAAWALCAVAWAIGWDMFPRSAHGPMVAVSVTIAILAIVRNPFISQIYDIFIQANSLFVTPKNNTLVAAMAPGIRWTSVSAAHAVVAVILFFLNKWNRMRWRAMAATGVAAMAGILFCVSLGIVLPAYRGYRQAYSPDFYLGQAWQVVERHIVKEPANIAYTGTDLCFGLFGAKLQNRVYTVPVHKNDKWQFHDCVRDLKKRGLYQIPKTDRIDFCRRDADAGAWIRNLEEKETGIVFISKLHQTDRPHLAHDAEFYPVERAFAQSRPDRFTLVYANPQVEVYRFH